MTDKKIFCNTPWYELHIYWDGSLGICCQEDHKLYPETNQQYNIASMSIADWFNSEPVRNFRRGMLGSQKLSACKRCYVEESHGGSSRRIRANQKSVIFTQLNFQDSYQQSPGFDKFESSRNLGQVDSMPIDVHIDLGNYCNLACKMCNPQASSVIASQHVKWAIPNADHYVGSDWTRDDAVWDRVLNELVAIPTLNNVHFMGGETLITRRFEDFVDFMIARNRTDLCFSFVTNGTTFNQSLLSKLTQFRRVGIEVSIETLTEHNAYQRQGTDNTVVLQNIKQYLEYCNGTNITLTVRPAISALTIGYYPTLLEFCWTNNLVVKSLLVTKPEFLDSKILPDSVRQQYLKKYQQLVRDLDLEAVDAQGDFNESNPNETPRIIRRQIDQCMNLLQSPRLANSDQLLDRMVEHCQKWDKIYGYNAVDLYPELAEEFVNRGY